MGWPVDAAKLEAMRAVNAAKLEELEAAMKDAEENMGDIELRDARLAKADYLCKLGAPHAGCDKSWKGCVLRLERWALRCVHKTVQT